MDNQKVVIFDFDGVIVNTFQMCFNIHHSHNPSETEDEYRGMFFGNINDSLSDAVKRRRINADFDFFKEYTEHVMGIAPVEGIKEVIRNLSESYPLGIVSSTNTQPIRDYLSKYSLEYFIEIYGNEVEKSKIKKLQMMLDRFSVTSGGSVFITDTLGDIKEAKKIGIKTLAVPWGYHSHEILSQGDPEAFADSPQHIISGLKKLFTDS